MHATVTDIPREHWEHLIDWAGQLGAAGVRLTVRAGTLRAVGPRSVLTPEIQDALGRYEAMLVWLLARADTEAIAWRVAAMLDALSRRPMAWDRLKARPETVAVPGSCRSCGEALPPARRSHRCADCARAIQLVARRVGEADLG